ncbi:MAG: hypothetical protein PHH27_01170 [Candidatus Colwellbacteria bacterium]|nr:hypothetical protein [Candidatus Colwellbacteria bacterium]MDD4818773.1 hypothetical protein [Candidatus Colwellbacteria bacterium]
MTRKNTFLVAGAVLIILVGAVLAYLIVTNPEMLTRVPTEQGIPVEEEGTVSEPEEEGEFPIVNYFPGVLSRMGEKIGDCLILNEENCASAFIPHNSDGERLSGIGFNIQDKEEITLYSPIDGYIKYLNTESDGSGRGEIIVTKDGLWKPASTIEEANDPNRNKSFRFAGYGVKPIPANDTLVNKGDPIGVMKVSDRLVYENYVKEETSLIFYPEASWDKDITRSEDPVEYLNQLVQLIEAQ